MIAVGSLANAVAIGIGSLTGLLIGRKLPENVRRIVFQGLGLVVLVLGVQMALKFRHPLIAVFSLLIGGVAGELLRIEDRLASLGDIVKRRVNSRDERFTEGLVNASLMYCVGSMAIIGAFDEGLRGDSTVLLTKAVLDGFISVALASTYGLGVMFSAIPVFLYQYGLTLFAVRFQAVFSPAIVDELTGVGGLLIMAIGINMLEIQKIKVGNLLPALVVVVVLVKLFV